MLAFPPRGEGMVCVARRNDGAAKSRRSTRMGPRVVGALGSPHDREGLADVVNRDSRWGLTFQAPKLDDRLGPDVGVILRLILIEDRTLGSVVPGQEELEPLIAPRRPLLDLPVDAPVGLVELEP